MKVVCISDTHGYHRDLDIPNGDILIHAGDIDPVWGSLPVLVDFNEWLGELPHSYKILVAGNHDIPFESKPELTRQVITNAIYLENETVEILGLKIFGSPHTIPFAGAFNTDEKEICKLWDKIPEGVDIVVTHGPPKMILDKSVFGENCGDGYLYARLRGIKPQLHVFGHIHESYGIFDSDFGTKFVNASILGRELRKPIVVELKN